MNKVVVLTPAYSYTVDLLSLGQISSILTAKESLLGKWMKQPGAQNLVEVTVTGDERMLFLYDFELTKAGKLPASTVKTIETMLPSQ